MSQRDQERAARKEVVKATIKRLFDKVIKGRTTILTIDLVKKKLEYNDNTPVGNFRHIIPFNVTTNEVALSGQKMKIGDLSGIVA